MVTTRDCFVVVVVAVVVNLTLLVLRISSWPCRITSFLYAKPAVDGHGDNVRLYNDIVLVER